MTCIRLTALLLCLFAVACGGGGDSGNNNGNGNTSISFQRDIQPLFVSECIRCHGGAGGLLLDTYEGLIDGGDSGALVVPGDPDASLLIGRLDGSVGDQMPLMAPALSANEIAVIRTWIAEGAQNN